MFITRTNVLISPFGFLFICVENQKFMSVTISVGCICKCTFKYEFTNDNHSSNTYVCSHAFSDFISGNNTTYRSIYSCDKF